MATRITARHTELSDGLRAHIENSVSKLDRYYNGIHDTHVVLDGHEANPSTRRAEVQLQVYRRTLTATNDSTTYEDAVNACIRQLRRQVLRYKGKVRSTDQDRHR